LRSVEFGARANRVLFVFKIDFQEVKKISNVCSEAADVPVSEGGSRMKVQTMGRK
jgi:hypothetical protein